MTIPAGWGLGSYTDDELADSLANVNSHLAALDGNRERLEERRAAILTEQAARALIAESRTAHP